MTDLLSTDTSTALLQASQANNARSLSKLQSTASNGTSLSDVELERIDEAATEFEAVFLTEMMKPMFEGIMQSNELFGGGKGEEVFKGFMLQEYGKMMAANGGIGISDAVRAEMIHIQESQNMTHTGA